MKQHFGCTICGNCCHDLRVPLTFREAIVWTERGHTVELLCEAVWPRDPAPGDVRAQSKRIASFPATSGTVPVAIAVVLVASFDGPCPNLHENLRCMIYDSRPLVCRIYPAEIVPYVPFDIARKACPPEAWQEDKPLLTVDGQYAGEVLPTLIIRSRAMTLADAGLKERLCHLLDISAAAVAQEGYMAHRRDIPQILDALREVSRVPYDERNASADWTLISNRPATLAALELSGASHRFQNARLPTAPWEDDKKYLGFYADDAP